MPIFWLLFVIGSLGICTVGFLSFAHLGSHSSHHAKASGGRIKAGGHSIGAHHGTGSASHMLHSGHAKVSGGKVSGPKAVSHTAKVSGGKINAGNQVSHSNISGPGNTGQAGHSGSTLSTAATNAGQAHQHLDPQQSVQLDGAFRNPYLNWAISHVLISPIDIFAFCLGAGAAGLFLESVVPAKWLLVIAIAGALITRYLVMQPIMNLILSFASKPSDGLEGAVSTDVIAESNFNHEGRGLIKIELDGQVRQVLAQLEATEISSASQISRGDHLLVLEVDPKRNICIVSHDLAIQTTLINENNEY